MNGRSTFYSNTTALRIAAGALLFFMTAASSALTAQTTPPAQQTADQDCATIKQEIEQLQEEMSKVAAEMQRLTELLDQINQHVVQMQAGLKLTTSPWLNETLRGDLLDTLAKELSLRKQVTQQLEDDANAMQGIKDEIADLLNKLANCGPASTTQPPKQETLTQPPPSQAPAPPLQTSGPTPSQTAPVQQTAGEDCEKIKQDIEQLQEEMSKVAAEMQRLTELLDQINQHVVQMQAGLKLTTSPWLNETLRGDLLDTLAKELSLRKQVTQQLEDDANAMQGIKDEIADLLNKLANCAPPSTAQPPQQEAPSYQPLPPPPPPIKPAPPSPPQTSMSTTGAGIQFQLRGFGGASFINGNTPATGGFDGAVLFPLGNHVLVGPTAGFQWINSSIVNSIGSMSAGSTFIDTSAGFKEGNFGGQVAFPFGGWQLGIQGGATVANSTITQQMGFCGLGNATSPAGCTVLSTTTTNDTIVGPFVGGYIQHSIFSHVGVFAGYDWNRLKITLPSSGSSTPTSSQTTLDLNRNTIDFGIVFTLNKYMRHSAHTTD